MVEIGKVNQLKVVSVDDECLYLDLGEHGEILLPLDEAPIDFEVGIACDVFLYYDAKKRIVATTKMPYAYVGGFYCLKVVDVLPTGAFLDWGLPKDLFVPLGEQKYVMAKGTSYIVYVYQNRFQDFVAATSHIDGYLDKTLVEYKEHERVDLLICHQTDLGFNVIINNAHWGLIYKDEVFQSLEYGERVEGYIKAVRADGKIDVCLQLPGYHNMDALEGKILEKIAENGGALSVTDKSSPEVIYELFAVSKKKYKMALGSLYKSKRIVINTDSIFLL